MSPDAQSNKEQRVIVFSDTHGNARYMKEVLDQRGPFSMMLHLGDGFLEASLLAKQRGVPFAGVMGNEDYGVQAPETLTLILAGKNIFLMHGHQMEINPYHDAGQWEEHFEALSQRAQKHEAKVLLFGHTHKPLLRRHRGVLLANPGDHYLGSAFPATSLELVARQVAVKAVLIQRSPQGRWEKWREMAEDDILINQCN